MADLKTIALFFSIYFLKALSCNACDMSTALTCFGTATDLVLRLYWNPLDIELLYDISQNYCDKKLDSCIETLKANCSADSIAPYLTISDTTSFLCSKDLSEYSSCIGNADLQEAMAFCFRTFKQDYDISMADPTLSNEELKKSICSAYSRAFSCTSEMATIMCEARSRLFIKAFLFSATRANMQTLNCQ